MGSDASDALAVVGDDNFGDRIPPCATCSPYFGSCAMRSRFAKVVAEKGYNFVLAESAGSQVAQVSSEVRLPRLS